MKNQDWGWVEKAVLKNCASRDETASAKEGTMLNSSIQQEREKAGVKGRDEKDDEKPRGPLCTHGKWDFLVPSPPTFGLWQGQQQRLKKDAQHLSLSVPLPFPKLPRREAQPATLPQTHVPAAPSFPPPPPCEHNVPLIHHSACSTPALCLRHWFFWLDFLAILVTVHHRLARKSDFSTPFFFFFLKKPSSRGMGDLELLRILLLIISTLIVSFHIHSYNDKQIWDIFAVFNLPLCTKVILFLDLLNPV